MYRYNLATYNKSLDSYEEAAVKEMLTVYRYYSAQNRFESLDDRSEFLQYLSSVSNELNDPTNKAVISFTSHLLNDDDMKKTIIGKIIHESKGNRDIMFNEELTKTIVEDAVKTWNHQIYDKTGFIESCSSHYNVAMYTRDLDLEENNSMDLDR